MRAQLGRFQLLGAAAIFGWTFVASLVIWYLLKVTVGIRVSEEQEYLGGDISECGVEAYPEFTWLNKALVNQRLPVTYSIVKLRNT